MLSHLKTEIGLELISTLLDQLIKTGMAMVLREELYANELLMKILIWPVQRKSMARLIQRKQGFLTTFKENQTTMHKMMKMINNLLWRGGERVIQYFEQCSNSILIKDSFHLLFWNRYWETMHKINGGCQRNCYTKGSQPFIIIGKLYEYHAMLICSTFLDALASLRPIWVLKWLIV